MTNIDTWITIQPMISEQLNEAVSEGGFKLNACKTPLPKARAYAEKVMRQSGKDLDEVIPNFDKNYTDLQRRCKAAINIPRRQMPVIEPSDMDAFHTALSRGHIDIFKPWAKGKLFAPTDLSRGAEGDEWLTLGFKDGSKSDDVVRARWTSAAANRLLPTQSEIWLEKLIKLIAKFGPVTSGSPATKKTLITSKEGYILDGHHRFGQAILSNPGVSMKTLFVPVPIKTLVKVGRSYGNAVGNAQKG